MRTRAHGSIGTYPRSSRIGTGYNIFEIKSVHTENFKRQTRSAIGQLLDYEYFQVKSKPENYNKQVLRGVVYNRRPPKEFIKFLKTYEFNVFWQEEEKFVGEVASGKVFRGFVS